MRRREPFRIGCIRVLLTRRQFLAWQSGQMSPQMASHIMASHIDPDYADIIIDSLYDLVLDYRLQGEAAEPLSPAGQRWAAGLRQ